MNTKTFNGKKYELWDALETKIQAQNVTEDLRKDGFLARVIDGGKNIGRLRHLVYSTA